MRFRGSPEVALQGRGDVLELLLIDADVDVFVLERVAVSARAPRELAGNVHDVFSKQQLNTNAGSHAALTVLVGQRRDRGGKPRAPAGNGKAGGYPPLPTGGPHARQLAATLVKSHCTGASTATTSYGRLRSVCISQPRWPTHKTRRDERYAQLGDASRRRDVRAIRG